MEKRFKWIVPAKYVRPKSLKGWTLAEQGLFFGSVSLLLKFACLLFLQQKPFYEGLDLLKVVGKK